MGEALGFSAFETKLVVLELVVVVMTSLIALHLGQAQRESMAPSGSRTRKEDTATSIWDLLTKPEMVAVMVVAVSAHGTQTVLATATLWSTCHDQPWLQVVPKPP